MEDEELEIYMNELVNHPYTGEALFKLLDINPEQAYIRPCPLCGSEQIQVWGDRNNIAKAMAKCRDCQCQGKLDMWQNRKPIDSPFRMA